MIDRMRNKSFPPEDAVRELRVPVFAFGKLGTTDVPSPEASSFTAALASEVLIRS
jgi:hypothetical protein